MLVRADLKKCKSKSVQVYTLLNKCVILQCEECNSFALNGTQKKYHSCLALLGLVVVPMSFSPSCAGLFLMVLLTIKAQYITQTFSVSGCSRSSNFTVLLFACIIS